MTDLVHKLKDIFSCKSTDAEIPKKRNLNIQWSTPFYSSDPLQTSNAVKAEKGHRITPYYISELSEHEVFVFGSNILGIHDGGASECAVLNFGAQMGQAEGPQGHSYAIPTDGCYLEDIQKAVDRFILYAEAHPKLTFLVTEIGCGTAGYHPKEIAPMFIDAFSIQNIYLPKQFWKHIK